MVDIVHLYFNKKIEKLIFWILFHIIILYKVPPLEKYGGQSPLWAKVMWARVHVGKGPHTSLSVFMF